MRSGCPVCGFDGGQVSPSDAAVALRSLPRRFAAALARPDDEDRPGDVLHRRPKGGGLSALEHTAWVATSLALVGDAFTAVMYHDDPAISLPPLDPRPAVAAAAEGAVGPSGESGSDSAGAAIADLAAAAIGLASAIEQAPKDGWSRTGHSTSGHSTSLEVVTFAVHLGVHHLRLAEQTVAEVAHELG
jgi:hypothetical protein